MAAGQPERPADVDAERKPALASGRLENTNLGGRVMRHIARSALAASLIAARVRASAGCRPHQDRTGERDHRPQRRGRRLHGQRHPPGGRRGQCQRRHPGPPDRVAHRGQPEHESGDRAGLFQAHRRRRHHRHRRSDPQHADPGRLADDTEGRHPRAGRRHRPEPDQGQQPVDLPRPAQRLLLLARDRRLRRELAQAQEVGHRALHRRVRLRRA